MIESLSEQHQQFLHEKDSEVKGDCWRTALACLLGLPRNDVPHFIQDYWSDDETDIAWWWASVEFVEKAFPGSTLVCLKPGFPVYEDPDNGLTRVIISGKSPRGDFNHCVMADSRTGELTWDVYPNGNGVLTVEEVYAITDKPSG